MNTDHSADRLSQITTSWSLLLQAHSGPADDTTAAQQRLFERYSGAVYRYLLAAVRDPNVADELGQELALRIVRGDFQRASPERGRFRNYLKRALFHLIVDYQRAQKRGAA